MALFSKECRFRGMPSKKKENNKMLKHILNDVPYFSNQYKFELHQDNTHHNIMKEGKIIR